MEFQEILFQVNFDAAKSKLPIEWVLNFEYNFHSTTTWGKLVE